MQLIWTESYVLILNISLLFSVEVCRSAKAGYYASKYKRFGNLCYVIGTLRAFIGHRNRDLKMKVSGYSFTWNEVLTFI